MRRSRWATSLVLALLLPFLLAALTTRAESGGAPKGSLDARRSGTPLGDPVQISFKAMDTKNPAVAYHRERQEYLVVWENDRPHNDEIQAQRLSASGDLLGDPFFISAGPGADRFRPDVVYNSQRREYLVVWAAAAGGAYHIHARVVAAEGGAVGPEVLIDTVWVHIWCGPQVAYSPVSDKYLVVWSGGSPGEVTGRTLNSDGSGSGASFGIGKSPGDCAYVAFNRSRNEYLVVWTDYWTPGNKFLTYGRRVQGDGTPMFPEELIFTTSATVQRAEAIAAMPTEPDKGQYLVGLADCNPLLAEPNLWALRVGGEAQVEGDRFPVFESPDEDSLLAIAADEYTDQYLLVGTRKHIGMPGKPSVILGREVSLDGQLLGDQGWIGGEKATSPAVAAGPPGEYLVVFADNPGTPTFDIYGRVWGRQRAYVPFAVR